MLIPSTMKKHNAMISSTILTQIMFLLHLPFFHKTCKQFLHVCDKSISASTYTLYPSFCDPFS